MRKRLLCALLALIMLTVLLPAAFSASADEAEAVYGAELWVDVPVDGLKLNGKGDVEISAAYTGEGTERAIPDPMDNVFKTASVIWYDTANPTAALMDGTVAQLGRSYKVSVIMEVRDLYTVRPDLPQHPGTRINGQAADNVFVYSEGSTQKVLFEKTFQTIQKSTVSPAVEIQETVLSPYEGNPMEIRVQVTGGTNVRYQWQIVYGSYDGGSGTSGGLDFSTVVNLADNEKYQGCRTPYFRMHSYFGDTFYQYDFMKIRCRITTDNGTIYTKGVWYTLLNREEVSGNIYVSGLDTPKTGDVPDRSVSVTSDNKCHITKVEWEELLDGDGNYHLMAEGDAFKSGQYRCRIYIATADAYKFGTSTKLYLNGTSAAMTTIPGKNQVIQCADTYYIERVFTITPGADLIGDLTCDGFVDNLDVECLLWYTLFPEDYPITCDADFNGDGFIDNKDVESLLWHTLFPEDYPLTH